MIVLMKLDATQSQVDAVCEAIRDHQLTAQVMPGERVAIGIPSAIPGDLREPLDAQLSGMEGVSKVTHVSRPFKLTSREWKREPTTVQAGSATFGPGRFTVIGGPCSIESYDQLAECAKLVKDAGATMLRGGAFKPRTSPYSFQGLAEEGLRIMQQVGREFGLATVTEVMSAETVGLVGQYVDMLQIGARSMQNFPLLIEAGKSGKPVFLKRGPAATIDEFLLAAEYVLNQGNPNVVLCERGLIPLDRSYTRNTLDLSAVLVLKEASHLPVVVDPSHGTGVARFVTPMTLAARVVGADGVMVEMHPNPKAALSDGSQALTPDGFREMMSELKKLDSVVGGKQD